MDEASEAAVVPSLEAAGCEGAAAALGAEA
jgi:hypothetical protein